VTLVDYACLPYLTQRGLVLPCEATAFNLKSVRLRTRISSEERIRRVWMDAVNEWFFWWVM